MPKTYQVVYALNLDTPTRSFESREEAQEYIQSLAGIELATSRYIQSRANGGGEVILMHDPKIEEPRNNANAIGIIVES